MGIKSKIIASLTAIFSKEVTTILLAMLPIFELRLSIPLAIIKFNLAPAQAYFLSLLGNLIPVIPLLIFFKFFFCKLENMKFVGKLFSWWFRSVERRSKIIEKWGFWGLIIFVAIPLPITGAWTGTVAATLFEMDARKSFLAISIGVAIAGIIVTIFSILVRNYCPF